MNFDCRNGFLGVDYIYLDTSFVPIKVGTLGGGGKIFFKIRLDLVKISHHAKNIPIRSKNVANAPIIRC